MQRLNLTAVLMVIITFSLPAPAATIRVPTDQPTIQAGIDAAVDGDTVLLADGVYNGDGNRDITFGGKSITVRSENGPEHCELYVQGSGVNPHRAFDFGMGDFRDTVVQGLTIRHGYYSNGSAIRCADGAQPTIIGNVFYRNSGTAIFCFEAWPLIEGNTFIENDGLTHYGGAIGCDRMTGGLVIRNNLFLENACYRGGAISCRNGAAPTIEGNRIEGNTTYYRGAGIYCFDSAPVIRDNTFAGNVADAGIYDALGGGIVCLYGAEPLITGNTFEGNQASHGGGIMAEESSPVITGNRFIGNTAREGGGLSCLRCSPEVSGNRFEGNMAESGAGIHCYAASPILTNNLLTGNTSTMKGGGLFFIDQSNPSVVNSTFNGNEAAQGGAICCWSSCIGTITNSIIWGNSTGSGSEIYIGHSGLPSTIAFTWSTVAGGLKGMAVEPGCTAYWWDGMIEADPRFVSGPFGEHYLSTIETGQNVDSPCVDAGDPAAAIPEGTTRIDFVEDTGIVDMGYHYPGEIATRLVLGPGPGDDNPPLVRVTPPYQNAAFESEFEAYGAAHFGVNVTTGDLTGTGSDEIVTGAGPGEIYGPHVRGFQANGTPLPGLSFLAYGTSKWGANVACGDVDADGFDEIVTGAGPGAVFGPHVRGWNYDAQGATTAMPGISFLAYGTPKWGVNVACGDIDGDGHDELVTGPGPGTVYGPHVRGWDCDGTTITAIGAVSFMAYGTHKYGVNVTCGDVDGDGIDEIVTGPGPGAVFGTHIRGWNYDGQALTELPGLNFFAWAHGLASFGATVFAGADLDGDGRDELVAGCGPDPAVTTPVKVYRYNGAGTTLWFSLEAFEGMTHGTTVAAGRF